MPATHPAGSEKFVANDNLNSTIYGGARHRQTYALDTSTGSGRVNLSIVPEPRAALLGSIGLLLILRRRS